jgi:hypothetical protein
MPTRRQFLAATGSTLAATAVTTAKDDAKRLFSFGLMADCQYADIDPAGVRFYRESPRKLGEAVAELNKRDLAFTFHLGDFIDRDFKSFDDLAPIVAGLKSPLRHALGNHDFDVPDDLKAKVPGKLGLEKGYYSFRRDGFRFVVIDTTDFSVYRHGKDDPRTATAHAELKRLEAAKTPAAQTWNSRPSDEQIAWIELELLAATAANESVLLFGHHPVIPNDGHSAWNSPALERLFRAHPCAKLYINGHDHAGGYATAKGFHYLTLDGMLNTKDENAFASADLYPDRLEVTGFGRQESYALRFL